MAGYTTKDLPNYGYGRGRTQYFNFQYDSLLSPERGELLTAELMQYCDTDLNLVARWFSGSSLDMSPPIQVTIANVSSQNDVGGSWQGFGPVPLQVVIGIGELPVMPGNAVIVARYLLVSEVSEMYMRGRQHYLPNDWFEVNGEGSKGEALSCFLGVQFLRLNSFPGVTAIPTVGTGGFNVSDLWLNTMRADDSISSNPNDNNHDNITGCATLFLFFLHDQLGFTIEQIINAGAGTLSNVYEKLVTSDTWKNAFPTFSKLVNDHFPNSLDAHGVFSPMYFPPFDTVFPVGDLIDFVVPPEVSWVTVNRPNSMAIRLDHPVLATPVTIMVTSSDESLIPSSTIILQVPTNWQTAPLTVTPQPAGFTAKPVTLTASYAGKSLTRSVNVIPPQAVKLPPLQIVPDTLADSCQPTLVEGTSQHFLINNLNIFQDQTGMSFAWSVTGATAVVLDSQDLTIDNLPSEGSRVILDVTVTNSQQLRATGHLEFTTLKADQIAQMARELQCRMSGFRAINLQIQPWVPVEIWTATVEEQLTAIEHYMGQVAASAKQVTAVIQRMKEAHGRHRRRKSHQ